MNSQGRRQCTAALRELSSESLAILSFDGLNSGSTNVLMVSSNITFSISSRVDSAKGKFLNAFLERSIWPSRPLFAFAELSKNLSAGGCCCYQFTCQVREECSTDLMLARGSVDSACTIFSSLTVKSFSSLFSMVMSSEPVKSISTYKSVRSLFSTVK